MKNYPVIRLLVCLVVSVNYCAGQTPINTVSILNNIVIPGGALNQTVRSHNNSVNGILPATNYNLQYNNTSNVVINSFVVFSKTYVRYDYFDTIILRRAANAWETTGGNKQQIYIEGNATVDNVTYNMPFPAAYPQVTGYAYMQRVMKEGCINRGSDNVFNNDSASDRTYNNIERVDFVLKAGAATNNLTAVGFMIAERGGNDPFKIAAITGVDANGNPTSFGPVLSVTAASYGSAITTVPTYVLRKDVADGALRPFSIVGAQSVKSVFISLSNLGIASMQRVYGYALMASDVTATTSAQLLNYTNTTYFPRTTTTATGGMDLASAPGIFQTDFVLSGHSLTLTAQNKNCSQLLEWTDGDAANTKEYQVERSLDGERFETLAVISNTTGSKNSYTDFTFSVASYYRIKAVVPGGEEYYSSFVFAGNTCAGTKISVYPNPAKDKLTVSYDAGQRFNQAAIVAISGKEIGKWNVNENSQQIQLDISKLQQGHYVVRLTGISGSQRAYPFIKL